MGQQEEEILLKKRFLDLSNMAYRKDFITFSNFLNLNEINLFYGIVPELKTRYQLFGGYEYAERQMIAFIPDALLLQEESSEKFLGEFPIACLKFSPVNSRFAEELTHRDILGALMSLGVERSRLGDIRIDDHKYYIFCEEDLSDYLLDSLTSIRHTGVSGERAEVNAVSFEQKFEELAGTVASPRLDNVVSFVTGTSRNKSAQFIQGQKVFVNAKLISSNSYECKENDVISIRGYGKFIYSGCSGETRKGRIKITVKKYL